MAAAENKVLLEREYVIPLRRAWLKAVEYKRTRKAIKTIRTFIAKHMKVDDRDESKVKINKWLNHEMWFRGVKHPPAKIKVKAKKYADHVDVELAEIPEKVKWLIAREAKLSTPAKVEKKEKKEEKKESAEKKEDKKEKQEAVKEAGLEHTKEQSHEHKHETVAHKEKTSPRRQVLQR